MEFKQLALIEPILKALDAEGYTTPTPIQQQAIPIVLQRTDLLGCAQTGTGKTAAFAIPIIQLLQQQKEAGNGNRHIKTLILTPTRELAIQIDDSFAAYGRFCQISHTVIFGGVSQVPQVQALKKGVDVLVATPGRLLDLISQGLIDLRHLEIFVLDEADRMLDMGFIHDVKRVIAKLPAKKQTLFFSATMPPEIQQLADSLLHHPSKVTVTPVSSTVEAIEQRLYFVDKGNKPHLLLHLLQDAAITSLLVFTRTKHGADKLVKVLQRQGIHAAAIHGNKSQNNRQKALLGFKTGEIRVLVATDIAARGIDIDALGYVINYELPDVPETYVHRIGRTGRAGASGIAITFCDAEERIELRDIQRLIGKTIPVVADHPFPAGTQVPALPTAQVEQREQRAHSPRPQGQRQQGNGRHPQRQDRSRQPQQNRNGQPQQNRNGQAAQSRGGQAPQRNQQQSRQGQRPQARPEQRQVERLANHVGNRPQPQRQREAEPAQWQPERKPQPQVVTGPVDLGDCERW
jgi:ATP-dependent RNA helicase RhlE